MKKLVFSVCSAVALLAAPSAFAQAKEFGDPGTLHIDGATTANFGYHQDSPATGSSTNTIALSLIPSAHYFVVQNFSVGGSIEFDWVKPNQGDSQTTFGIGPTVGYNLWLTPGQLSLWPKATFLFKNESRTVTFGTTSVSGTLQTMNVGVYVPLEIHPVRHFDIGVGPYFNIDVSSKASANGASADFDKFMNVGIMLDVGGWTWLGD